MEEEKILNENLTEKKATQPKSYKKLIIVLVITSSFAIISTILLLGYYKFNWFQSEIYKIDAEISRNIYECNYFTEIKTIESRIGFTSGNSENKTIIIHNNFIVVQTNREELENNDFLNTAALIILDSKLDFGNEVKQYISFNISDEEKIDEFKSNPDGTKYPMAIFSFYENGTLEDIYLPNNTDNYNAISIIELIEILIPKLSRNRTEDINNGIKINAVKNKTKKILVENLSTKEIQNFKNSKFSKYIERDIENGLLTSIRTSSNLTLESSTDNEEEGRFGLKDFSYQQKSKIFSTQIKKEEDKIELIQSLSKYYNFIKSQDLLKKFENKENETKEYIIEDLGDSDYLDNYNSSSYTHIRNLREQYEFDKTFTIKKLNVLGVEVTIKVRISIMGDLKLGPNIIRSCLSEIIISSNLGEIKYGTHLFVSMKKTFSTPDWTILYFNFPPIPNVGIALKAAASLTISSVYEYGKIKASISGSITAKASISAEFGFANIGGGASGTIVSASLSGAINRNGAITRSGSLSAGEVKVYVEGKSIFNIYFYKDWKVFDGWYVSF